MSPTGTIADDRGFTLVELLVVVTLLALTASIMLGWLPGLADRLAVDQSSRQIQQVLARAANIARNSGRDQVVTFDVSGDRPRLVSDTQVAMLDPTVAVQWLGARETGATSERGAVVFLAIGGASGGAVALRRGSAKAALEVDWLTGRVHQQDGIP